MPKDSNNVIPMQSPAPLKHEHPFGTPNPEDALIDLIDLIDATNPPKPKKRPKPKLCLK